MIFPMVFPWFADGSATLGHSQNGGAARAHHRPRRGCRGELGAGRDAGAALGAQVRGPICFRNYIIYIYVERESMDV